MDERISTSNLASTETKNESLQNGGLSGSKQMPVWYRTPMKKPQSRSRKSVQHKSSAAQTTTSNEADKYLASVPEPARATLNSIRATIRSVVSLASPLSIPTAACSSPILPSCSSSRTNSNPTTYRKEPSAFLQTSLSQNSLRKKTVKARIAQNESRTKR
jgi:hypothetical protein